jgi:hypothetical protein
MGVGIFQKFPHQTRSSARTTGVNEVMVKWVQFMHFYIRTIHRIWLTVWDKRYVWRKSVRYCMHVLGT